MRDEGRERGGWHETFPRLGLEGADFSPAHNPLSRTQSLAPSNQERRRKLQGEENLGASAFPVACGKVDAGGHLHPFLPRWEERALESLHSLLTTG